MASLKKFGIFRDRQKDREQKQLREHNKRQYSIFTERDRERPHNHCAQQQKKIPKKTKRREDGYEQSLREYLEDRDACH